MDEVKPGDIIFAKPKGVLFTIVRWWTGGQWGHVGLVTGNIQSHTLIVEAEYNGIDQNDLFWKIVREEEFSIYRIEGLTDSQSYNLVKECLSCVGMAYDKSAWLNFLIGSTWFGSDKMMYCSEMIYRALRKLNIIEDTHHPEKISPADLFRILEPRLSLVRKVNF